MHAHRVLGVLILEYKIVSNVGAALVMRRTLEILGPPIMYGTAVDVKLKCCKQIEGKSIVGLQRRSPIVGLVCQLLGQKKRKK